MAQKPTKIDDVKRPGRAAPLPTSRPIVVTNRPMLANDPMVVSATQEHEEDKQVVAATRVAKVIKPLDSTLTTDVSEPESTPDEKEPEATGSTVPELAVDIDALHETKEPETEPKTASEVASPETTPAADTPAAKPEAAIQTTEAEKPDAQPTQKLERDPEAELSAEEIAAAEVRAKRDLELEQVIASGKYRVPINAVQRRRSRMHVLLLCVIGVLLVIALLDAVMDAGFVKLPVTIPHTHFFSTTPSGS